MAKTLRITTILAALAALGLIILIASKGIASNKEIDKFLASPGIAEQMQSGSGGKSPVEQETPLIRQAKTFALRINPPPPEPVKTQPAPQEAIHPKVEISAKFKLVGTSYHTGDEENSWALIDEVGKGWHWVNQGEKVGYLVIEKIGDGVVLIRDGNNTYELAAERTEKPNYVKSFSGSDAAERTIPDWQGKKIAVKETVSEDKTSTSSTENAQSEPAEDPNIVKKQVQESINWVKQLQENPGSAGMTKEEANELGNLGEFLKTIEAQLPAEANEPNTGAKPGEPKDNNEPRVAMPAKQPPVAVAPGSVGANQDSNSPRINRPVPDPNQAGQNIGPRGLRRIKRTR
ncbi:MAG: hypothetical protein ABSE89_10295 [Sedimentisphaerales bacterium]